MDPRIPIYHARQAPAAPHIGCSRSTCCVRGYLGKLEINWSAGGTRFEPHFFYLPYTKRTSQTSNTKPARQGIHDTDIISDSPRIVYHVS